MKFWLRAGLAAVVLVTAGVAAWFLFLRERLGPPPFEALDAPQFVSAAQADFLDEADRVLGVSGAGVAKAYPVPVVAWHHIIHDRLGDLPILPTW